MNLFGVKMRTRCSKAWCATKGIAVTESVIPLTIWDNLRKADISGVQNYFYLWKV